MCELLGINSKKRLQVNEYLREFYHHSEKHCHGWGQATFYGDAVQVEKEPIKADSSNYLHSRLEHPFEVNNLIAHIRLASVGRMKYENCHPFVKHDNRGRSWTLAHNGTIFNPQISQEVSLDSFKSVQEGETDSERILFYLIDCINERQEELGRALKAEERFSLLDQQISMISIGNKLNLLIWDGEFMYAHTNYADTLSFKQIGNAETVVISTLPLDNEDWQPVPFLQLQVFKQGELVWQGMHRSQQFFDKEKDWEYKNFDYATL